MIKEIPFTKMQGAGNDFLVILAQKAIDYPKLARRICDRGLGVGADGLLVLDKSKKADYRMRIINADGSVAEMCGNGVRCLAAYIVRYLKPVVATFSIETLAGNILAQGRGQTASVKLTNPGQDELDIPLDILGQKIRVNFINTGVPHTVVFVDHLKDIDVVTIGRAIRYHTRFSPQGTNVNFVEQLAEKHIAVRTYERGVENETNACGTGSVASAVIACLKTEPGPQECSTPKIKVLTKSGEDLEVSFALHNRHATDVWLKGSAKFIAQGIFYLEQTS